MEKQPTIEDLAWNFLHILHLEVLKTYEFTINYIDGYWTLSIDVWEEKGKNIIQPVPYEKFVFHSFEECIDLSNCAFLEYENEEAEKKLRKVNIKIRLNRVNFVYNREGFNILIEAINISDSFIITKDPVPESWVGYSDEYLEPVKIQGWLINTANKLYTEMVFNKLWPLLDAVKKYVPDTEHPNAESDSSPHHVSDNVEQQLDELRTLLSTKINN